MYSRGNAWHALSAHGYGFFSEKIEQDRKIMRCEIPNHIRIALKKAKVQARCIQIINIAQFFTVDIFLHGLYSRIIFKSMTHHQNQSPGLGQFDQFLGITTLERDRLFHKHI